MKNYDLVKKPVDFATGESPKRCKHALFPGYGICGAEPEIIVKLYDSLLFQMPDTGIYIHDYTDNNKLKEGWKELGKPTLIVVCPRLAESIKKNVPEIKVESVYDMLMDLGISGGCNKEAYCLHQPEDIPETYLETVKALAEDMGVEFHSEDEGKFPYITSSIRDRDKLKAEGKDAAHILELIFGMGDSNTHLIHEDHDGEECDGNCESCSLMDDCEMEAGGQKVEIDAPAKSAPSPLPTEEERDENRKELREIIISLF